MTEAIAQNNDAHADNLACLANALPAAMLGNRVEVAGILMTFRHHECQRRRARRQCGIDVPSPHEARQRAILWALRATIISQMQGEQI